MKTTGNSSPLALCIVSSETWARSSCGIGVGNQRGVIEKIANAFAALRGIGRGVEQFVEIGEARAGFLGAFLFEHFPIAGPFQKGLQESRRRASSPDPCDSSVIMR